MTPPKCRICGVREHGHRCRGGQNTMMAAREQQRVDDGLEAIHDEPGRKAAVLTARRRWHTEEGDDGEARDVVDSRRKPARFYAPPGQCAFCDRRREAAKRTMRAVRERGEA